VESCPQAALEIKGVKMTVNEVMDVALKDKRYYESSGGGLTISGGEPMAQYNFTLELLRLAKENKIHTCLETCGHADTNNMLSVVPYVDYFLYDYKAGSNDEHVRFTGVSQNLIMDNLRAINKAGAKIIFRCPVIPGYNDNERHFEAIANTVNSLDGVLEVNILPYHPMGASKAKRIGEKGDLDLGFPTDEQIDGWLHEISKGVNVPVQTA
jgi:pyruvate formate lyase activating enzyme